MTKHLKGKTVAVTRPLAQAAGLIARLEEAGAKVIAVPLLDIVPNPLQADLQGLLEQSQHADVVICVSVNAAEIGLRYCHQLQAVLPSSIVAAGKATASVLEAGGIENVLIGGSASNSEEILALALLRDVTGNNINIWRGGEGRTLLGDTLRSRGAAVTFVDLYQRMIPSELGKQVNQLTAPEVDIITVTSVAGLENLTAAVAHDLAAFEKKLLLVGSKRLSEKAVAQGFSPERIVVAANPGDDEMLAALEAQLPNEGKLMTEDASGKNVAELSGDESPVKHEIDNAEDSQIGQDVMEPEPLAKPVKQGGSKFGTVLATLSFLLAATGIGGAYYFYEKEIKPALNASASVDDVQQLNSKLQRQTNQIKDMGSQVEQTAEGVSELRTTVSAERTPFILAQVEHLLEVANDRLTYMSDTDTASAALQDALGRLDLIDPSSFSSLRDAVNADLKRVRDHEDLDANDVLSGLATLISDLRPLPTDPAGAAATDSDDNESQQVEDSVDTETPKTIGGVWKSFTESLTSQVKVIKNDDPVSGFSTTAINRYKLELLQLRLEAMRLSLIRNDLVSFNTELAEAQTWSIENLEHSLAQPILTELLRLRRMNFAVVPNLQSSLSEVKRAVIKSEQQVNRDEKAQAVNPEAENFAPMRAPSSTELEIPRQKNRLVPPRLDGCGGCSLPEPVVKEGTVL